MPLRFVVLTDQSIPDMETRPLARNLRGWWSKAELFAPEHADLGHVLYFDLDTVIVGDLTDVVRQATSPDVTLLSDFYRNARTNSGMMALSPEARAWTWESWDPATTPRVFRAGDGDWINDRWKGQAARWQEELPGQVVSYKAHCRTAAGVPQDARVVCFHGQPRPWRTNLRGG